MEAVSVVVCDEMKRRLLERSVGPISPRGPTFAYLSTAMPRYWHLAVFRDQPAGRAEPTVFGVGVVKRGDRITDLEFKLHVAAFRPTVPALAVAGVAVVLKGYSDAIDHSGVLTEARGRRLREAVSQLVPGMGPILQELAGWTDGQSVSGAVGEQLGMEKDGLATLFEVARFDRSFLTGWIDPGGDVGFVDGLPLEYERRMDTRTVTASPILVLEDQDDASAPAAIQDNLRSADDQRPAHWVSEDQLIQFDHQRFSDWLGTDGDRVGWRRYTNRSGTQRLSVYYANLTPVERTFGVDLLYYHQGHGCYVLVQYKKMAMEKGATEWRYRPDKNLRAELDRMRDVDDLCRSIEKERQIAEFRLLPTPCMVKLCEAQSLVMDSSQWIQGMYLAREQFEDALAAPTSKGPRGGVRLTYSNVGRYLNATTFTTLLKDGWIGSRGTGTEHIERIVDQILETGRAAMVGVHDTAKPLGNRPLSNRSIHP
jgi:hypothetical protein